MFCGSTPVTDPCTHILTFKHCRTISNTMARFSTVETYLWKYKLGYTHFHSSQSKTQHLRLTLQNNPVTPIIWLSPIPSWLLLGHYFSCLQPWGYYQIHISSAEIWCCPNIKRQDSVNSTQRPENPSLLRSPGLFRRSMYQGIFSSGKKSQTKEISYSVTK